MGVITFGVLLGHDDGYAKNLVAIRGSTAEDGGRVCEPLPP